MDLGKKLREALAKLTNKPYVDEAEVKLLVKEIQRVLISSDVNIKLVFELSKRIEKNALDKEKMKELTLKEHVVKVVYDELTSLMGETYHPRLDKHRCLVVGLYGSGKTTSIGKIAYFYKSKGMKVGVIAADTDRPAAQDQLEQLSKQVGVNFYTTRGEKNPAKIVKNALKEAEEDIIIVDSAGRNAFDEKLSKELKEMNDVLNPDETYLVVSADIGQIAGKQAEAFRQAVPITGVIVTKLEGSGKGGGALSAVSATGTKIAFIGTGEKMKDLQVYDASRFVGKLLGIPDIKGLLEKIETIQKEEDLSKLQTEKFNLQTFYDQLKAAKKMGPLGDVFGMMGMADLPKDALRQSEEKLKYFEAIINSMTLYEKENPDILKKERDRIERVAKGSGRPAKEVKELLAQFFKVEKMMKMFKKDRGFKKKVEGMMKGGLKLS
ncbi:signal recognition particle protein [Candidatus Micrarchaeota archaeon]|nr:signal recognition particle protein [Candidatus Micrarchaeota archaeon]